MGIDRNSDEDNELDRILDKVMQNVMLNEVNRIDIRCCRADISSYPLGILSVRSYNELMRAIRLCRLAFILVSSTYCPYCHMFEPVFAKVAKLYVNKAVFIEVNADYVPEVVELFGISSTPTTVTVLDGEPIDMVIGYIPFPSLNNYVSELLYRIGCIST